MAVHTGIGVIILQNRKVLLGKRLNSPGEGTWSFPGGHLELFETWEDCARREVFEEANLHVDNLKLVAVTNDIFRNENKHYVTIFLIADSYSGALETKEPEKCERWEWFDWDNLPSPLFLPVQNLIKQGFRP